MKTCHSIHSYFPRKAENIQVFNLKKIARHLVRKNHPNARFAFPEIKDISEKWHVRTCIVWS